MRRFGQIIRLKPGHYGNYKKHHAEVWPEVLKTITACNIRNYSIFHKDGLLFAYMEYVGDDFEADMKKNGSRSKNTRVVGRYETDAATA